MNELKENFQLCYFSPQNAKGEALKLMFFGFKQIKKTYLYKNQDRLKEICDAFQSKKPDINEVSGFVCNNLIDSIKIHICFENFLKAIFLINDVIIHKLAKEVFPELYKKQKKEPIQKFEILRISNWEVNDKIKLPELSLKKQIKGILRWTLGTNILTKAKYLEKIGIANETLEIIKPYLQYRNNLHYYSGESFSLTNSNYSNFRKIIDFVNANIVRIQNDLVDELRKGDKYKLQKI